MWSPGPGAGKCCYCACLYHKYCKFVVLELAHSVWFYTLCRLQRQRNAAAAVPYLGKMAGAVGNYNAHMSAYPEVDWQVVGKSFVESLGACAYAVPYNDKNLYT